MDKPPEEPGNVVRLVIEAPHRRSFMAVDVSPELYAAFAALAASQGKEPEELLSEGMQYVFDKYGKPTTTGQIIRPGFPKPKEPTP